MKKVLLSLFVIFSFVTYVFYQRFGFSDDESRVVKPQNLSTQGLSVSPQSTTSPIQSPTVGGGGYKDGQYTGNTTDAFYGNVQVKAIITSGQISDVQFLQYPNDRRNSVEINTQAMPFLKSEAIQAQSAQVDIVSGATQTSLAFRTSLQSALDQAK